jgi:hypothetical protein
MVEAVDRPAVHQSGPGHRAIAGRPPPDQYLAALNHYMHPDIALTAIPRRTPLMPNALTAPAADPQENNLHVGHSPILEPPEGPESALACTCGGLLELRPASKSAQMSHYDLHLKEARHEALV